jgi:hypothetical protein
MTGNRRQQPWRSLRRVLTVLVGLSLIWSAASGAFPQSLADAAARPAVHSVLAPGVDLVAVAHHGSLATADHPRPIDSVAPATPVTPDLTCLSTSHRSATHGAVDAHKRANSPRAPPVEGLA